MRFTALLTAALLLNGCQSALVSVNPAPTPDWLVETVDTPATARWSQDRSTLVLSNGLAERTFTFRPHGLGKELRGVATTSLRHLGSGEEFIRAVEPEAVLEIDGRRVQVGGLKGQVNRAFLRATDVEQLSANLDSLPLYDIETGPIPERIAWKQPRWSTNSHWPPAGLRTTFIFGPGTGVNYNFRVLVHYDLYEGLPLFAKTVVVDAGAQSCVFVLQGIESERLAVVEAQSSVEQPQRWMESNLHVESEMGMFGQATQTGRAAVRWEHDPAFGTRPTVSVRPLVARAQAQWQMTKPIGGDRAWFAGTSVGVTGGRDLPPQWLVFAGGPWSAPGYDWHAFGSRALLSQRLEFRTPVPAPSIPLRRFGKSPPHATLAPFVQALAVASGTRERPLVSGVYPSAGVSVLFFYDLLRADVARGLRDGHWRFSIDIDRSFWGIL